MTAAGRWRAELAAWAIPDHIAREAVEPPWGFPVELFRARPAEPTTRPDTDISARRALEALPPGGSLLDVGCGGGAAGLALVPTVGLLVGVDESEEMLEAMAEAAQAAGVPHETLRAKWPDEEGKAPTTDVVVSHHVLYNVPDLASFASALTSHARRRIVVEMTARHPLAHTAPLWDRFWGVPRPDGPDADLALEVLADAGIDVKFERWSRPARAADREVRVALLRRQLCLAPGREAEVDDALGEDPAERPVVTAWWEA